MFSRFFRWFQGARPPLPAITPVAKPAPRESFFTTERDIDNTLTHEERMLRLEIPRTVKDTLVLTGDGKTVATFDSNNYENSLKAAYTLGQVGIPEVQAMWYGSQSFIGYQMCALMAQHWLINKACLIPARDAIRKGYEFTINDGAKVAPDVLAAINKANKKYRLNRSLVEYVKMARVFGIRVALFKVESDDPDYYVKPFNPDSVTPGSYRGISQVDPYWCVPELTNSSAMDPSSLDFYEPTYWIINSQRYHKSHLVIAHGPDVADILKPAYLYGGLSVPQMIYERVYAAERTANEAPQLALTKRAMVFYTDAAKALANQAKFEERLAVWAQLRDNYGIKVADKEADQVEQHDTSLADLDAVIMTQYQIVAAAANIPVTKLMGTQLKGFSTGDGEAENYHEELESIQVNDMEPLIDRHMVCLIRSEIVPRFGGEPFAVDCTWEPVKSVSPMDAATVRKIDAETAKIYAVDIGAIDGEEVRARISADEESGYNGLPVLTDEDPDDGEEAQANPQA